MERQTAETDLRCPRTPKEKAARCEPSGCDVSCPQRGRGQGLMSTQLPGRRPRSERRLQSVAQIALGRFRSLYFAVARLLERKEGSARIGALGSWPPLISRILAQQR